MTSFGSSVVVSSHARPVAGSTLSTHSCGGSGLQSGSLARQDSHATFSTVRSPSPVRVTEYVMVTESSTLNGPDQRSRGSS